MKLLWRTFIVIPVVLLCITCVNAIEDYQLKKIAQTLTSEIVNAFPSFSGQVLSVRESENGVYINLGEKDGLTSGERFEIYTQVYGRSKKSTDKSTGFEGELLALIEVDWVRDEYSFARIVKLYSETPVDHMDLLRYIQPERKLYLSEFDDDESLDLSGSLQERLNEVDFLHITKKEYTADYRIDGRILEHSRGINVLLILTEISTGEVTNIEKKFITTQQRVKKVFKGNGYRAYRLEEVALDFISMGGSDLLILGKEYLYKAKLDSSNLTFQSKDKLSDSGIYPQREPIGRIDFFDLDGDGEKELLLGRIPSTYCRYYAFKDGKYILAGPLPGLPLGTSNTGKLLISNLDNGYNLFDPDPAQTYLITVSSVGSGGQSAIWNINKSFLDAAFLDFNQDGEVEIAVLYPDGTVDIIYPSSRDFLPVFTIDDVGLGLHVSSHGYLFTSTNKRDFDRVQCYSCDGESPVKVFQTPEVPYHIYRINTIRDKITALAIDDSGVSYLVVFD